MAVEAEAAAAVTNNEIAEHIRGPKHAEAVKLAKEAGTQEQRALYIRRYRQIVNFDYWRSRCRAEQLPSTLLARRLIYEAIRELKNGRLDSADPTQPGAKQLFEAGFVAWGQTLTACPAIEGDEHQGVSRELVEAIVLYRQKILEERPLPEDFALKGLVDRWNKRPGHGKE